MTGTTPDVRQLVPAALLAAVLVLAGSIGLLSRHLPQNPAEAWHFEARGFNFVMGSGGIEGDRMVVDGFTDGHALLSSGPVAVTAGNHRFLRLSLDSRGGEAAPVFFWRSADAPSDLVRLQLRDEGRVLIDLSTQDGWRGDVVELGFLFEEAGGTFAVGPVSLEPDRLTLRLQRVWDGWTTFEGWSQKSVNFLQGGSAQQSVRLPVLVIAWLTLTVGLAWLLSKHKGGPRRLLWGAAAAFLAAWTLLDIRWTTNSLRQAEQTLGTYRGASEKDRLDRGLDGIVYRYVSRLKTDVLPAHPTRILIVADERSLEYYLQRAKYHLLPHSVYAARQFPAMLEPHSLDYVIFLGPAGGIHHIQGWSPAWEQALRPAFRNELGEAYAIVKGSD